MRSDLQRMFRFEAITLDWVLANYAGNLSTCIAIVLVYALRTLQNLHAPRCIVDASPMETRLVGAIQGRRTPLLGAATDPDR